MTDPAELKPEDVELTSAESAAELTGQHAADAADSLEDMDSDEAARVLGLMPPDSAAEALAEVDPFVAARIMAELPRERAADLLELMAPDDAADVLGESDEAIRDDVREEMADLPGEAVDRLLAYEPDTAGGIMSPYAATIPTDLTVREAIEAIRRQAERPETIYYVYVLDAADRLAGVVSMRALLLSPPERLIRDVRQSDLVTVHVEVDREHVAREMEKYNFMALPVVDDGGRLVGIVTHDDVIDVLEAEASEDMQVMVGAGADERPFSPWHFAMKKRLPWLHINLLTAFLAASIVQAFSGAIEQMVVLAVLMPIVAGMGGNSGAQGLAVTMRGLALGDLAGFDDFRRLLGKELLLGLLNGLAIGLTTGVVIYLFQRDAALAAVIGLAMLCNLLIAATAGVCIPMGLRAVGLDPAQGSNILLTLITDAIGFLIFLGLAVLLLFPLVT